MVGRLVGGGQRLEGGAVTRHEHHHHHHHRHHHLHYIIILFLRLIIITTRCPDSSPMSKSTSSTQLGPGGRPRLDRLRKTRTCQNCQCLEKEKELSTLSTFLEQHLTFISTQVNFFDSQSVSQAWGARRWAIISHCSMC